MDRRLILVAALLSGCTTPGPRPEPSLAPRSAEAIDPRVPIGGETPPGTVDQELAAQLSALAATVRAGVSTFDLRAAEAARLAAAAGPMASESWVVAQRALSRLVESYGVTTNAAAEIDALAAHRLRAQRWISAADQRAIAAAAADVAAISARQASEINRLNDLLAR